MNSIDSLSGEGLGVGFRFGVGLGSAIPPISGCGVGFTNGIFICLPTIVCFENSETKNTPVSILIISEKTAVVQTDNRCLTFAHPTGQSAVNIVPSLRLKYRTQRRPSELLRRFSAS